MVGYFERTYFIQSVSRAMPNNLMLFILVMSEDKRSSLFLMCLRFIVCLVLSLQ